MARCWACGERALAWAARERPTACGQGRARRPGGTSVGLRRGRAGRAASAQGRGSPAKWGAAATGKKVGEEREGDFSPTLTKLRRRHSAGEEGERGRGASSPQRSTARCCAREFGDGGASGGARLRRRRWRGGKRSRGEELGEVRERGSFGGVVGEKTAQNRLGRCTVGGS
jgi:hypothetical protein